MAATWEPVAEAAAEEAGAEEPAVKVAMSGGWTAKVVLVSRAWRAEVERARLALGPASREPARLRVS